jgi:hypothetical protein
VNEQKGTNTNIESLMEMLGNKDGTIRQNAREALVALGKPAVSSLTRHCRIPGRIKFAGKRPKRLVV